VGFPLLPPETAATLVPVETLGDGLRDRLNPPILTANSSSVMVPSPLASESLQLLLICVHSSFSRTPFLFVSYCRSRASAYLRTRSSGELPCEDPEGDGEPEVGEEVPPELEGRTELLAPTAGAGEPPELETALVFAAEGGPNPGAADPCEASPNPGTRLAGALLDSPSFFGVSPPDGPAIGGPGGHIPGPDGHIPGPGGCIPPGVPPDRPELRWESASRKACTETGFAGSNPARRTIPS
jgi:hypothetical protein